MDQERHLDGNSLGGALWEVFGREMTDEEGCCGTCGAVAMLGALMVYADAPGQVARCPVCGAVSMVLVRIRGELRVTFESLRWVSLRPVGA